MLWKGKLSRAQTDQTDATCCGGDATSAPRELDFPYYSLRDGFSSTLNLVSASPKPIDLTIAFRSKTGQTLLAPPLTIQPQAKLALDLRKVLTAMSADTTGEFAEGSVAVFFEGTIMPVVGQVTITNPATGLVHESEMVENDPGRSDIPASLNSGWWDLASGRDATVMVSNTSGDTAMADVFLDFQGERHASAAITLLQHETKTLSVTALLGDLGVSPSEAPEGGISIVARGSNPKLIAQGKVFDAVTGFSTTLDFPDPARQMKSALHASGVPIGSPTEHSPFAGMGNFVPRVVARNLLGTAQSVTITLEYPAGKFGLRGDEEFDGEGGEGTETLTLGPFPIEPYGTQDISLIAAMGQLPLPLPYCSIRIQHSGSPGTLVAQVSAVDSRQNLVVDSRVANEGDGWAGSGANPWRLDNETESILFLTNMSGKDARIGFNVAAADISYDLTHLRLAPHETRAIDLRKLRDAQLEDFKGNKIPVDATDGSVNWIRLDNVPVMGRLVVIEHHKGVATNFDCPTAQCPPGLTSVSSSQDSAPYLVGQSNQHTATAVFTDANYFPHPYSVTTDPSTTWSSNATRIATVNNTTTKGLVTGVAGGTATITPRYCDYTYRWFVAEQMCVAVDTCLSGPNPHNVVQITGPNTVWWFNGQTPSGYATTITLTALPSGGTSYSWSLLAGTDKAVLSGQSANTVKLTGNDLSTTSGDVTVQVSVTISGGTKPVSKNITVRGPYKLVPLTPPYTDNADSTRGYSTIARYEIQDNFSTRLPSNVDANEQWTSSVIFDSPYSSANSNWIRGVANGAVVSPSLFQDQMAGPLLSGGPVPTPTAPAGGTTKVFHWGQAFWVGSSSSGLGARVQTDTQQFYIDHGRHLSPVSPAP